MFYIGNDEEEKQACENVGIDTSVGTSGAATDIISIYDNILSLGQTESVPADDDDASNTNLPGTRLYDKTGDNGER